MVVRVLEKTIEEMQVKLGTMNTELNKIAYLESALKVHSGLEIKRFIWASLVELYDERKMYEKAGKAMSAKAGIDITFREKIESYLRAGEMYAKAGRIEDADHMFVRAMRNANASQKQRIRLAMKNIYLTNAKELEQNGKTASSVRFYEKLMELGLDDLEKKEVKVKLVKIYKTLGKFREAELIEGGL